MVTEPTLRIRKYNPAKSCTCLANSQLLRSHKEPSAPSDLLRLGISSSSHLSSTVKPSQSSPDLPIAVKVCWGSRPHTTTKLLSNSWTRSQQSLSYSQGQCHRKFQAIACLNTRSTEQSQNLYPTKARPSNEERQPMLNSCNSLEH